MSKQYKNAKEWTCKFCGSTFVGRKKFYDHLKVCNERLKQPLDSLGRIKNFDGYKKAGETLHQKFLNGELKREYHKWTPEERIKMSEAWVKRVGINRVSFNKKACVYIDFLNEKNGWKLQHALNGGEKQVGPYFLDGYDAELNIAFEYDEKYHNVRKEKDKIKADFIIEQLGCKFYRYDEEKDLFYEYTRDIAELV